MNEETINRRSALESSGMCVRRTENKIEHPDKPFRLNTLHTHDL